MNDQFFKDLELIKKDDQQWLAYQSMSNTVVTAGPGSGKTRVLALKAVALSEMHIKKPAGLALISYSRETVRELKKRLKLYGFKPGSRDFVGTVHSFSLLHVIQPFGHLFPEYRIHYPVKLLPKEKEQEIYQGVLSEINTQGKNVSLLEINRHRSLSQEGKSEIKMSSKDIVAMAAAIYEKKLRETEYLDFPALINLSAKMINEKIFIRDSLRSRFPWLLIDEYQDLGKSLHEMVLELSLAAGIKLFAVGDIHQSIYGFTGGYPDFLEELTRNDDIRTIPLSSNYRSNQHIITASLETLLPAPPVPVYTAKLRQDEAPNFSFITCGDELSPQYRVVSEKVIPKLIAEGTSLNEIGILVGSNVQVKAMAIELGRKKIPFYISKWAFENSAVVVWLQYCACWCVDYKSQSFDELFRFWKNLLERHDDNGRFLSDIELKVSLHKILESSKGKFYLYDWLGFVVSELNLALVLKDSEMYPNELDNLRILLDEAKLHNLKGASLGRFASLGFPDNEVTITTRHSAKGLEFEVVIMLGMEESKFPNYYALKSNILMAEAQRLCYVSISRAKRSCILIRSCFYTDFNKRKAFQPSRFWAALFNKFGTATNNFTDQNYS